MTLRISGKNFDIGPALRSRAQDEILGAVSKYFDGSYNGHLTVEKEGTGFQTECTLHLATGRSFCVTGSAHDAHASLSVVVERMSKQLRRYKREKRDKKQEAPSLDMMSDAMMSDTLPPLPATKVKAKANGHAPPALGATGAAIGKAPAIVAERLDNLPRHSVPEAAEHMEGSHLQSFVFRNHGTERVNILRLREDGSIGWIDVPASP